MIRPALSILVILLGVAAPAAAFWNFGAISEPHSMLALGAALVIAATCSRGLRSSG